MSFLQYFSISYWQNYLQIPTYSPNYSDFGGFQIFGQTVLMYFFILITAFALAIVSIMESMGEPESGASSYTEGKEEDEGNKGNKGNKGNEGEGSSFSNIINTITNTEPSTNEAEAPPKEGESENKSGGRTKHKKRTYKKKSNRYR